MGPESWEGECLESLHHYASRTSLFILQRGWDSLLNRTCFQTEPWAAWPICCVPGQLQRSGSGKLAWGSQNAPRQEEAACPGCSRRGQQPSFPASAAPNSRRPEGSHECPALHCSLRTVSGQHPGQLRDLATGVSLCGRALLCTGSWPIVEALLAFCLAEKLFHKRWWHRVPHPSTLPSPRWTVARSRGV